MMSAGLSAEGWAWLALSGVAVSVLATMLAIEPGFILVPLLLALLPKLGVSGTQTPLVAVATAIVFLIPWSLARLGGLSHQERRRTLRLAPGVIAGAFFGATLVLRMPGDWLLMGFAGAAAIFALGPKRRTWRLAVTPPQKEPSTAAAILKSVAMALFGAGFPLVPGRNACQAALTLVLGCSAVGVFLTVPNACGPCAGLLFMPGLVAIGMTAVLTMPVAMLVFGAPDGRRMARRIAAGALAVTVLGGALTTYVPGTMALAAFAPGVCGVPVQKQLAARQRPSPDPIFSLVRKYGPRPGLQRLQSGHLVRSPFLGPAIEVAARPAALKLAPWTASIEVRRADLKPDASQLRHRTSSKR